MQQILGQFFHYLRQQGLPVSPAESLDALRAAELIGIDCPSRLQAALGMTLAKTPAHHQLYRHAFEQFFSQHLLISPDTDSASEDDLVNNKPTQTHQLADQASGNNDQTNNDSLLESELGQLLINDDNGALELAIAAAAAGAGANQMKMLTQKGQVSYQVLKALGDEVLRSELAELEQANEQPRLVEQLKQQRERLVVQVRDYVERQFLIYSSAEGRKLRESNLQRVKLSHIDQRYQQQMAAMVRQAARQLATQHGRRRRQTKRGLLDVRKTLAANAAFDGYLFHTRWKSTRIERPRIMVLCDVSGSVSRVARFLLLFLHSLQDVLPRVRSFVFSSDLGEVTELFEQQPLEQALALVMAQWGERPTDYGQAMRDFQSQALDAVDNKTTVIMLGDARNNNRDGHPEIWRQVYQHSHRVLWLNPEDRTSWNNGDSIIADYAPFCSTLESCNSLRDLKRILGRLLKYS